jgi:hypothetical protein
MPLPTGADNWHWKPVTASDPATGSRRVTAGFRFLASLNALLGTSSPCLPEP